MLQKLSIPCTWQPLPLNRQHHLQTSMKGSYALHPAPSMACKIPLLQAAVLVAAAAASSAEAAAGGLPRVRGPASRQVSWPF